MKNFDIKYLIENNKKVIIISAIALLVIALIVIVLLKSQKNKESLNFGIKEIILYNNANVISNSSTQALENINVCQYSDLSIYINNSLNTSELTDENTIKKLYIDNIYISSNKDNNSTTINYKNPLELGKYTFLVPSEKDKIKFNVIRNNEQNSNADYNKPTFYTDCSNPITLGYLNSDIVQNYSISDTTNTVSYNAKILKEAGVILDDINNTINFTIHIVDNTNKKFYCNMSVNLALDDDFLNNGYSFISLPITEGEYKFFRE